MLYNTGFAICVRYYITLKRATYYQLTRSTCVLEYMFRPYRWMLSGTLKSAKTTSTCSSLFVIVRNITATVGLDRINEQPAITLKSAVDWSVRALRRVRKIAKSDYLLRHVCPSVLPSAWHNSAPTGRIFIKCGVCVFFENVSRKFNFR
jgi:hypothetical protein